MLDDDSRDAQWLHFREDTKHCWLRGQEGSLKHYKMADIEGKILFLSRDSLIFYFASFMTSILGVFLICASK